MPITASYTDSYVKGVLKMFLHKFPDDTNEKKFLRLTIHN